MLKITEYGPVIRFDLARTLAGRGRYYTNAYLLDTIMIDTGCAHTSPELQAALSGKPLTQIVNTHTHEDHIGANAALQNKYRDLEIRAHPEALKILEDPARMQPLHLYRQLFWGWPQPSQGKSLAEGAWVESERFRLQVIFTPGHSHDHICVYEPEYGWMFSGDLFVGGKDRALRQGCDIWGVIASLKKIASLPTGYLFPGSARVRQNPAQDLASKIAYLEELGDKVIDLHQRGYSIREITRRICGGPMFVEVISLGHFSRRHLVCSFLN